MQRRIHEELKRLEIEDPPAAQVVLLHTILVFLGWKLRQVPTIARVVYLTAIFDISIHTLAPARVGDMLLEFGVEASTAYCFSIVVCAFLPSAKGA